MLGQVLALFIINREKTRAITKFGIGMNRGEKLTAHNKYGNIHILISTVILNLNRETRGALPPLKQLLLEWFVQSKYRQGRS